MEAGALPIRATSWRRGATRRSAFSRVTRSWQGRIGLALLVLLLLVALLGPMIRPHDPSEIVGPPLAAPGEHGLLGTDALGRDVLSRVLSGGFVLVLISLASALVAYSIGVTLGLLSGFKKGYFDLGVLAALDLLISVPAIIIVLVLITGAGTSLAVVCFGIGLVLVPGIGRISRTVTRDVATSEFVEAAVARGETTLSIVAREILPNLWTPLLADFGIRVAYAVTLYASLAFLGFGRQPPAADWGLMISENRTGLLLQPWAVIVPALAIALLTIGINLIGDAYARTLGRSVDAGV